MPDPFSKRSRSHDSSLHQVVKQKTNARGTWIEYQDGCVDFMDIMGETPKAQTYQDITQASTGTANTSIRQTFTTNPGTLHSTRQAEEEAQRTMMQVLAWCVYRLGGLVSIPLSVIQDVTYSMEQAINPDTRALTIVVEEIESKEDDHYDPQDDLPF